LPILAGDPVNVFILKEQPREGDEPANSAACSLGSGWCYHTDHYYPLHSEPLSGSYNDYGGLKNVADDLAAQAVVAMFQQASDAGSLIFSKRAKALSRDPRYTAPRAGHKVTIANVLDWVVSDCLVASWPEREADLAFKPGNDEVEIKVWLERLKLAMTHAAVERGLALEKPTGLAIMMIHASAYTLAVSRAGSFNKFLSTVRIPYMPQAGQGSQNADWGAAKALACLTVEIADKRLAEEASQDAQDEAKIAGLAEAKKKAAQKAKTQRAADCKIERRVQGKTRTKS
jgi:hypothetical protein